MLNGKRPAHKQETEAKCWVYTIPNYTTLDHIPDAMCKYRIQGEEICPTTGTPHLQCYVNLIKEVRWKAFTKAYPQARNVQKAKGSPYSNFVYCSKDGNFKEFGIRPKEPKEKDTTYDEALQAATIKEGLDIIKSKRPRDYCLHGEAIERNLKSAKTAIYKPKYVIEDFNIAPIHSHDVATLVYGPSGLGKTHYACSHFKNPLVVSHIDTLKKLTKDNDGIVFDDMCFNHWPVSSVIHLLDQEFERAIHVRYGTINIPALTPKIFTYNMDNPFYDVYISEPQREAIERRIKRVHVHTKLFGGKERDQNDLDVYNTEEELKDEEDFNIEVV